MIEVGLLQSSEIKGLLRIQRAAAGLADAVCGALQWLAGSLANMKSECFS